MSDSTPVTTKETCVDTQPVPDSDKNMIINKNQAEHQTDASERISENQILDTGQHSQEGDGANNIFKPPAPPSENWENLTNNVQDSDKADSSTTINDGFLSPMSLPPVSKSVKKDDSNKRSPVQMSFRSKFAIPADIYKAKVPKIAAFMADRPAKHQPAKEEQKAPDSVDKSIETPSTDKPKPQKPPPAKLTYEAPNWGCVPASDQYYFEVLKMGAIVGKTELVEKEYFVVGRLADCDIKMEHPSISRYHAIIQHGAPEPDSENVELQKDGSAGFYVYDLGSTHGTLINKTPIPPKVYFRLKVGHVVKFGGSTRMFILQGPSDDQEEETQESATELRVLNKQKIKKKKDLERMMLGEDSSSDEDEEKKSKNRKTTETSGVTWGMLEDAVQSSSDEEVEEEEGDSLDMHPDAVKIQVKKEAFYVKDPMKALKNLYEREKMELDFECDERRSGNWHIRLSLPVDGPGGKPVYAEINATGKKKPAMAQCALEACRILERHGMFHHTDHHKQKAKQWEKDDFYDSDEDEFHDRTGDLEKKRSQRMKRVGKSSKAAKTVETYESLCKKVSELDAEVKDIEARLQKDKEATRVDSGMVDPLDAFMQQVKSGKALDTATRAKLKRRLFEAKKEHARVSKLADLARPSSLPPLANSFAKTYSFIGKMKGKRNPILARPVVQPEILVEGKEEDDIVEEEEDEEAPKKKAQTRIIKLSDVEPKPMPKSQHIELTAETSTEKPEILTDTRTESHSDAVIKNTPVTPVLVKSEAETPKQLRPVRQADNDHETVLEKPRKRTMGPTLPPELKDKLLAEQDMPPQQDAVEGEASEPKKRRKRIRKPKAQDLKRSKPNVEYTDDPNYSSWLPPEDQSGDGKISLNEKLGY